MPYYLAAYGTVEGVDWRLMVIMDKDELYESVTKQVLNIAQIIVALIIPLGLLGLVFLLRPFSDRIAIYVEQLHQEVVAKEADEHGVDFLKKPVDADDLAKRVAGLLSKSHGAM